MKTTVGQKIIRTLFWLLLIYLAISTSLVWAIQLGLIPQTIRTMAEEPKNPQAVTAEKHYGESSFAEQFVREYYSWAKEDEKGHLERLKPFLAFQVIPLVSIDTKDAKYKNSDTTLTSTWDIKERPGTNIKDVTVFAEQWLSDGEKSQRVFRYLVVPVTKAGNSYRVADQPYEIPRPVASPLNEEKKTSEKPEGQLVDEATQKKIEEFLTDFWTSYTQDSKEKIGYMMQDQKPVQGYKGLFTFVQLSDLQVVKNPKNEYEAKFNLLLTDAQTGIKVTYQYQMVLVEENNRYYVAKMKQGEK